MTSLEAPRDSPPPRVAQRLVIVLATTGEFDSRTYRIASAAAARGHVVTVMARWAPGLERIEVHPAGYRIVRVRVSAIDGVPLVGSIRRIFDGRRSAGSGGRRSAGTEVTGGSVADASNRPFTDLAEPARTRPIGRARRALRPFAGAWRLAAIVLTIRSQIRAMRLMDPGADVYHAMAYMGIPVGLAMATRRGGRIVYDARDIYIDANNLARLPRTIRWLLARAERRWVRRANRIVTVNRPYAEVMASRWGPPPPAVVMNCSYRYAISSPRPRLFHERLGLDPDRRIVLYQGGFSPHRGIEQLLTAIRSVPCATLVLLGYGSLAGELHRLAAAPELADRVRILPAVPPPDLLDWVASADVVAMPIQPSTLNHRLTTPNKLFEAMAAGVPVVASDLPGMAAIVTETRIGQLVDPTNPAAIAEALRTVLDLSDEDRATLRDRALAAAGATYNWETQSEILFGEYERLTGLPW